MKCGREDPYLFLEDLRRNEARMDLVESDTESLGQFQSKEKVNSHKKFEGKLKKILKNCPYCAKHAFFATEVSCQEVAKITRQNTSSQKI